MYDEYEIEQDEAPEDGRDITYLTEGLEMVGLGLAMLSKRSASSVMQAIVGTTTGTMVAIACPMYEGIKHCVMYIRVGDKKEDEETGLLKQTFEMPLH